MKRLFLTTTLLALSLSGFSQSNFGFSVGTSKSDHYLGSIWYQHPISNRFSIGLNFRYCDFKYRFVNAIAINSGKTVFTGLVIGYKIAETENFRLDFNLTSSYRYLENQENITLPSKTIGLEFDPNILMTLRMNDKILYHTGAMLRTSIQLKPEVIGNEQQPSGIVLNGISLKSNSALYTLRTYAGPMSGATGDTEKFFWMVSVGCQFNIPSKNASSISFLNF
ncbi:MAG: hypothetical protein R3C61_18010 [Bacteroidia bacterium]